MISINVLFISLHHPDSDQNDQDADDVLKRKIFVKMITAHTWDHRR